MGYELCCRSLGQSSGNEKDLEEEWIEYITIDRLFPSIYQRYNSLSNNNASVLQIVRYNLLIIIARSMNWGRYKYVFGH